ncbi:DUF2158 domain-containing protein [Rhodovulum sulfidophilum]|nr:DUF2158 domain-containing protein [Rhodovulum sulfidophilum]MBL3587465.1 DUF2158 domain-containing protein [Rhodovulum sulfidophilum]
MAQKFKPGDIVQLKSGGPSMTVSEVAKSYNADFACYHCE